MVAQTAFDAHYDSCKNKTDLSGAKWVVIIEQALSADVNVPPGPARRLQLLNSAGCASNLANCLWLSSRFSGG